MYFLHKGLFKMIMKNQKDRKNTKEKELTKSSSSKRKAYKVNITDIATETGLSISTVSRVLNGKAVQYRIGKKSQEKILAVAKELNYVPNLFAANLRTGKSNTIALIVPSLNNPFFANLASTLNAEIRQFGYTTIISDSDENIEVEELEIQQVISRNVEGLIIAPCGNKWEHLKKLHDKGFPIICIDRYFKELDIPYVSTDNYNGAYTATKYLIENGHTLIAAIQGVKQSTPNKLRVEGFKDAMEEQGIKNYTIVGDDFTMQNGYLETLLLLQQKEKPTAILTFSTTIAMGCMKALKELNVAIPNDISIITFDDHPYLDYLSTPISCIAQPVSDISKMAVKFLLARINKEKVKKDQILFKPEIKFKKSIGRIN